MDDVKRAYREAENKTKEELRRSDGDESLADKAGNVGDDIRTGLGNAGDENRQGGRPRQVPQGTRRRPRLTPCRHPPHGAPARRPGLHHVVSLSASRPPRALLQEPHHLELLGPVRPRTRWLGLLLRHLHQSAREPAIEIRVEDGRMDVAPPATAGVLPSRSAVTRSRRRRSVERRVVSRAAGHEAR